MSTYRSDRSRGRLQKADALIRRPPDATSPVGTAGDLGLDRGSVVGRQRERYGGVKTGSAFFGWLTATGTAVLLTALLVAAGTAVGVATNAPAGQAVTDAASNASAIGVAGGIVLLAILFLAYYCGGYVAGRMARFNGARQGLAVWLWALVIAAIVASVAAVGGSKYDVLGTLNSFPRFPIGSGALTRGGVIALLAGAAVSLLGAVLGGLAGMRFHRNVDKAGYDGLSPAAPVTTVQDAAPAARAHPDWFDPTTDPETPAPKRQE
jgi:hypothetical protein